MAMFRAKKLDIQGFINARVILDHTKRKVYEENEVKRQALRFIVRNTQFSQRHRVLAQLELNKMHCYTRSTQIHNRCMMGGRSRGVLRDFNLARYQFRMHALRGDLPGVKKASW